MLYSHDEFFALITAVEKQGGQHLDAICPVRRYDFSGPKSRPFIPPQHSEPTLFVVPYEALDKRGAEAGLHPQVACAVEDDMGRWPRFASVPEFPLPFSTDA